MSSLRLGRRTVPRSLRLLILATALVGAVSAPFAAPARGATCSVPGGYATIAAALADPTCTTIVLAAGAYTGPVAIDHSVIIQGPNVGVPGNGTRAAEAAITSATEGITISDGTVTIDGVQVTAAVDVAIATSAEIDALTIVNSVLDGAVGISVDASGQITVDNNLVTANGGLGINLPAPGTSSNISGNTVDGVTGTSADVAGIRVTDAGGTVTITGNTVSDVVGSATTGSSNSYGIRVNGSTGLVTVGGNAIDGTAAGADATFTNAFGIDVFTDAAGVAITNNTVTDTDCDFDYCGASGINVYSSSGSVEAVGNTVQRTSAEGTTSINTAHGIAIFANDNTAHVAGNTVSATHASTNSIADATGISGQSDGGPVLIEDNTVSDTVGAGVGGVSIGTAYGIIGGRYTTDGVTVTGNTVSDTSASGSSSGSTAVLAFAFDGSASATDNIVVNVTGTGVSASGAVNATASGNTVSGLGETGILVGGGTGTGLASNNLVTGGDVGVQVQAGYEAPGTLTVTNNLITGSGIGLSLNTANFDVPTFSGVLTATSNTILDSDTGILIPIETVIEPGATARLRFNRIVGNDVGLDHQGTGALDAINNWWGCNEGPGATDCDDVVVASPLTAAVDSNPWLVLGLAAGPGTNQATAELTDNSDGVGTQASGFVRNGTPVAFTTTFGTPNPAATGTLSGEATTMISSATAGSSTVCTEVDNEEVCRTVAVSIATPPPSPSPSSSSPSPGQSLLPDTGAGLGNEPASLPILLLVAFLMASLGALTMLTVRYRTRHW